jgi:hypothetical protein
MTKSDDNLCACGCGQPCRVRSKYASDRCQQKASRIAQREYNNAYQTVRRTKFHHAYPAQREVTIIDPKVADPYTVKQSEFEMYRSKYLPGTKVIIDGAELVL